MKENAQNDSKKEIIAKDVISCFKKFKETQRKLQKKRYTPGRFIFRGINDAQYGVVSTAARRLRNFKKQDEYIRYHVNLVESARRKGYDKNDSKSTLTDLEILANIQHYGGATCLTDFTTNFLIALWMATLPSVKADGKIVWLDLSQSNNFKLINYCTEDILKLTIQKILSGLDFSMETKNQNKAEPCYWLWEPASMSDRIQKQNSIFLFSLRAFPQKSDTENNLSFGNITIPYKYKRAIRKELEDFLGISAESVFNDFSGFALNANGNQADTSEHIVSTKICMNAAKECIKKTNYSLALSYLDEAIECTRLRDENQCHCRRKINKKYYLCKLNLGEIKYWRGFVNKEKAKINNTFYNEAILNFTEAIDYLSVGKKNNYIEILFQKQKHEISVEETNHNLMYDAFRELIDLYYDNEDYNTAIFIAEDLWNLYLKNMEWKNNGHDVIFIILELSLLKCDKIKFDYYIKESSNLEEKFKENNGSILLLYFKSLGNAIFNDKEINLINEYARLDNEIDYILNIESGGHISLIGYYYWNFNDILEWINNTQKISDITIRDRIEKNKNQLILFTEKMNEAQNKLVNHVFSKSKAFN